MTDNLIEMPRGITRAKRERSLERKDQTRICAHHGWLVDDRRRTVTCRVCGQVTDALDVLLEMIDQHDRMLYAEQECYKLRKQILELQGEQQKLRASVRGMRQRRGIEP